MTKPFATIILAGGKGTRMGTSDKHKVCFEVLGEPGIVRALETYNLCGASLNVVVVGMLAETVMATVNARVPGVAFAFQECPRGTGDAARKGADLLERVGFEGDILVVAGDKVIQPKVIRQLLAVHRSGNADLTLATAKRPPNSSTGILLKTPRGHIVGILEEQERQRLLGLARLNQEFESRTQLTRDTIERLLGECCGDRAARQLQTELVGARTAPAKLTRTDFESRFGIDERRGLLCVAGEPVSVREVAGRFGQMNLSTYVFRAPVLYDALASLTSHRTTQEEYLTDVIEILANRPKPARVLGCEIEDTRDLMAFNDPQELLAIEEVYRQRHLHESPERSPNARLNTSASTEGSGNSHARVLLSLEGWENLLQRPSADARRQFRTWYGEEVPYPQFVRAVRAFAEHYGTDGEVAIVRSPGRINLMGRHIDHQGGDVNVMAINREIVLIASPRTDDVVRLANHDGSRFSSQVFRVSDLIAKLNWDDWQHVVDGPRIQRLLEAARGDWANYVKAAILRLQEQFRDRQLRGLDLLVSGDIPMGAGLSSSSALVVATAEMVRLFNHLPVSSRRLVSLCGEGEWFVGTRGGAADHAAIKLSHRGYVTRVGFFPFRIQGSAPFFPDHVLVACNSGIYAGKSAQARNTFNAKVAAYHIGRVWFKMLRPDLAPRIEHLRDIDCDHLGLSPAELAQLLQQLPLTITRHQVQTALGQIAEAERTRLERIFLSHDAPKTGYPVRGVVLFGLSEIVRARRCLDLLKSRDATALGRLMNTSHDGDRVSRETAPGKWRRQARDTAAQAACLTALPDLANLPGNYGCSLPELDRIADIARRTPGVEGAQLAGAGLGGCIMVLARKSAAADLLNALTQHGVQAEVFRPIAGACNLTVV